MFLMKFYRIEKSQPSVNFLHRLGRPIAEKLFEQFFIKIKLIRHVFRLQIFLFSILYFNTDHPYLCVLTGAARVGGTGVGSQSLRRYCLAAVSLLTHQDQPQKHLY